jgi:flagellar export protein FliJ
MKAFRFRGARILEWRRVQADAARVEFVRAAESVREAAARIKDADEACDRAAREYRAATTTPFDVGTLLRYRNWIGRERGHADACRKLHQERSEVADVAAGKLQVASRHMKVMERLRDRAWRRHLDAERRQEMKEIDQLATLQYARRKAEEGADREY